MQRRTAVRLCVFDAGTHEDHYGCVNYRMQRRTAVRLCVFDAGTHEDHYGCVFELSNAETHGLASLRF